MMIATISAGRRIAVALGCVALIATSASAECAWVLWTVQVTYDPKKPAMESGQYYAADWQPTFSAPTAQACDAEQKSREKTETFRLGLLKKNDMFPERLYRCLPDTADPRGPKGK